MFNEIYEWVNFEENIINKDYDYISDKDLENLSKNCNTMKFNIGFDEIVATEGRILKSSSSTEQFNELINNHYNPDYYQDIEILDIIETDYYYCAITNYLYYEYKTGQRYLISFKQNIYDYEKDEMYIDDKNVIKLILDTLCYYGLHQIHRSAVVHSEIIEEQDYYTYAKYEVNTIQGDLGCSDIAYYIRTIYRINKTTSIIEKVSVQTINSISYDD